MEQSGFYWIRFTSPQGHVFEPLVAWRTNRGWRIPGSADSVPDGTLVDILEGPLPSPSITQSPVAPAQAQASN